MTKPPKDPNDSGENSPAEDSHTGKSDYEIGYGRPPERTRWKVGQSGNPKGRPKRRKNLRTVVDASLDQLATVIERGRRRKVSKRDLIAMQLVDGAVRGDPKALANLLAMLKALGMLSDAPETSRTEPITDHDAEIIQDFLRRQGSATEASSEPDKADEAPKTEQPPKGGKP